MSISSIIQLAVLAGLVVFGLCGNAGVPILAMRTNLRCYHVMLLAALDFTMAVIGSGVLILMSLPIGPEWLEHNKLLCQSLMFLSTWVLISHLLVLFFLALFCQKVQYNIHPAEQMRVTKRQTLYLVVAMATGLLMSIPTQFGWSSFGGLPQFCNGFQIISNYSLFYLLCSFLILCVTVVLSARAAKHGRLYPVKLLWESHLLEVQINDPEMTTSASSNTISDNRSYRSRNSSVISGLRSAIISSSRNTPIASRKSSHQSAPLEGPWSIMLGLSARPYPGNRNEQGFGPEALEPQSEGMLSACTSGSYYLGVSREPFVISSRIRQYYVPTRLTTKNIFQSPKCLPSFTSSKKQRSLSRFLFLKCCLSLVSWLPLYTTGVLQLLSVHYPQELNIVVQWLLYLQSSISPLLLLCDAGYRQSCRRAAHSLLNACSRRKREHVYDFRPRDIDIERTEHVRLRSVVKLNLQTL